MPENQWQYQINGGGSWINIGSPISIGVAGGSINVNHNEYSLRNSTSLVYRIQVVDSYQTTTSGSQSIAFSYRRFLGYNSSTSLTLLEILALPNSTLTNSRVRTITNVTAGIGNYTYYVYAASAGDLADVLLGGVAPILGAFTKLADVTGLNVYDATVNYRIYKSNDTNAFTNNTIAFI